MHIGTCDSVQDLASWFDQKNQGVSGSGGTMTKSVSVRKLRRSSTGVFSTTGGIRYVKLRAL